MSILLQWPVMNLMIERNKAMVEKYREKEIEAKIDKNKERLKK
jgi:hypothetical protein